MAEMEGVLEQFLSGGRHDSAGFFTIDVVKALPKLSRFQLPHPSFFLLKWIQWAVASGAVNIRVRIGYARVVLEHDGRPPSVDEMSDLLGYVFAGQRQALHHLAVGMATALTLGPRAVLECESGRFVLEGGRVRSEGEPRPGCRLTLQRPSRQPGLEEQLVHRFCPFCPAALWVNSVRVDRQLFGAAERPWFFRRVLERILPSDEALSRFYRQNVLRTGLTSGGELKSKLPWWYLIFTIEDYVLGSVHRNHHLLEARLLRSLASDRVGVPPDSRASLRKEVGEGDCWALIAVEMALEPQARVGFVRDGVMIPAAAPDLPLPGLVMAVSSEGLTTDASEFALVEDEALKQLWETLQAQLAELADSLLQACESKQIPLDWYVHPRLSGHYRENRSRRERGRYSGF